MTQAKTVFTVIGYYDDTGQAYSMPQPGIDAYDAMRNAALGAVEPSTLCIVGAIPGVHGLITPGCDNGSTAYALDLAQTGEGVPEGYNVHHDALGWYIIKPDEEEPEDGHSLGFDGRTHYAEREEAIAALATRLEETGGINHA